MVTVEREVVVRCPACGQPAPGGQLSTCLICRTAFCERCAVTGYGRTFCSHRCAEFFFYGDTDESDAEE